MNDNLIDKAVDPAKAEATTRDFQKWLLYIGIAVTVWAAWKAYRANS